MENTIKEQIKFACEQNTALKIEYDPYVIYNGRDYYLNEDINSGDGENFYGYEVAEGSGHIVRGTYKITNVNCNGFGCGAIKTTLIGITDFTCDDLSILQ